MPSGTATDPADFSAHELLEQYRRRTLSPVEALTAIFARLDAVEPRFNTYRVVDREGALLSAKASEARFARGEPPRALEGVPVALKDLLDVRGLPTRRGSLATHEHPALLDSPAAARVREAGAILLGKSNTAEFGWKSVTESALAGITRNPWNPEYTPTGSSGGAAAAAALGLGPLHVGTDGGGSIRVPAAATGVFGLKPSFGRVPNHPPAYNSTLFVVGPIARSVSDAALLLNVLMLPDVRDFYALPAETRDYRVGLTDGVRGLRIAYARAVNGTGADPNVLAITDVAVQAFDELGASVVETALQVTEPRPILDAFAAERAARLRRDIPRERYALVDEEIRQSVERAERFTLQDYVAAWDARNALTGELRQLHERFDLLVTPTTGGLIPRLGERVQTQFSALFNLTGQPAASVPAGFDENGLPVGLQIVGPAHRDDLVLRAARAFESLRPFPRPPI